MWEQLPLAIYLLAHTVVTIVCKSLAFHNINPSPSPHWLVDVERCTTTETGLSLWIRNFMFCHRVSVLVSANYSSYMDSAYSFSASWSQVIIILIVCTTANRWEKSRVIIILPLKKKRRCCLISLLIREPIVWRITHGHSQCAISLLTTCSQQKNRHEEFSFSYYMAGLVFGTSVCYHTYTS